MSFMLRNTGVARNFEFWDVILVTFFRYRNGDNVTTVFLSSISS